MLNVGELKALLEGVDDETPLAVELTNVPPGPGIVSNIIREKVSLRVTGVWHKGVDGEGEAFVLAGYSPSIRRMIPRAKRKTSQD